MKWFKYGFIGGVVWISIYLICCVFGNQVTCDFFWDYLFKPFESFARSSELFLKKTNILQGDDMILGMCYLFVLMFLIGFALGLVVFFIKHFINRIKPAVSER